MTQQPVWEFVANLGDVNVADYGGFIVYRDTNGVYAPEVELYEANEDETGGTMYRFALDPPRFNKSKAWFVSKLPEVASSAGSTACQLLRGLLSKDPVKRAGAYQAIVGYFGPFEFDQYPVRLSENEAQERYAKIPRR